MFDADDPGPDYELRWPRALFVAETTALLRLTRDDVLRDQGAVLLEEAFSTNVPRDDFTEARDFADDPWATPKGGFGSSGGPGPTRRHLTRLLHAADRLPEQTSPRPYWPQRRSVPQPARGRQADDPVTLYRQWTQLIHEFEERGYLEHLTGKDCVDDPQPVDTRLETQIDQRLGIAGLWPLRPGFGPDGEWPWDEDTFYGLVEVFHDLMARPRSRSFHDFGQCGWHHRDFAARPGQSLYRWQVNRLLARHGIKLQLAESGEDAGRLIRTSQDDRDELVRRALATPAAPDKSAVEHAIAQFRSRAAGREEKRSAVVALARVLEDRQALLKAELFKSDENALFHIANKFDLRHRDGKQYQDYDEAFLDWIFWWYLATHELTDQLMARQNVGT